MKAPKTICTSLKCQNFDTIQVPIFVKEVENEKVGIISFHHEIRVDKEFLEYEGIIVNEKLEEGLIETDYLELEGADKKSMMKLIVNFQHDGSIDLIEGEVLYTMNFKVSVGPESSWIDVYLKFLHDLPKFPTCDCYYFGEDGVKMDDDNSYTNGLITIVKDLVYAPITKLPKIEAKVGEIIECPITTTGMNDISAITLHFKFDNKILRYLKTALSDELSIDGSAFYNCVDTPDGYGMWIIAWSQLKPISQKEDESLAIIQFEVIGKGSSELFWMLDQNEDCEYADKNAKVLPETDSTYVNGYVNVE